MQHFHLIVSYFKAKILTDFAGKDFFSPITLQEKTKILANFIKIAFKKKCLQKKNQWTE